MKTGNPATTTVSVAGVAPPGITQNACEELEKKNEEERQNVVDTLEDESSLNQQEQATLDKAAGTGMTISSALSQVPGAEGIFSASSSGCAQACNPDGLVEGGTSEQKMGSNAETRNDAKKREAARDKAGVLCDKTHQHPGGGKGAHAEAKICNHMSGLPESPMRGGSLLLSIDWRFKRKSGPKRSGMPCESCHAMLCHAQKECDIQIFICDKNNNPQPLSTGDCEDEDSYSDLCQRIDGNPTAGR
jgi:hypothetical protein